MSEPENQNTSQFVDDFDDFPLGNLNEEKELSAAKVSTPQERADEAVKNALLENRKWRDSKGKQHKVHNISDAHTIVWNQIISDGRSNDFQVISLLWCLLKPPKQIVKFGALNVAQLRMEVMNFMVAEQIKGERFEQLEDALATMLEETQAVQVVPASDGDDGEGKR